MITLRCPIWSEHQALVDLRNDNLAYFFSSNRISLEAHLDWYHGVLLDDSQEFFVIEADGDLVGTISLMNIDRHHKRAEYGRFLIAEDYRSMGHGKEALTALLKYAFGTLSLHKVYGDILNTNVAAITLDERLGFEQEGIFFDHVWKDGRFQHVVRMAVFSTSTTAYGSATNYSTPSLFRLVPTESVLEGA